MVIMTLTSKWKTVIRRCSITFVILAYYLWLAMAILSFGHIDEKESIPTSERLISLEYHQAIIDSIYRATDNVINVALIGFPIAVALIIVIFKKVR